MDRERERERGEDRSLFSPPPADAVARCCCRIAAVAGLHLLLAAGCGVTQGVKTSTHNSSSYGLHGMWRMRGVNVDGHSLGSTGTCNEMSK
uniref:Uncharacterized protein n=1 Tax=Leersia perrieri TaxID=77586 RepID=A0A0D9XB63_9ORYZ